MRGINVLWRDLVLLLLMVVVGLVMIYLPHLNPVATNKEEDVRNKGEISIEAAWVYGVDFDVDLWVRAASGDVISYKTKHTPVGDLLRDDLGVGGDQQKANFEVIFIRDARPGFYTINLHLYNTGVSTNKQYLPTDVEVRVMLHNKNKRKDIFEGSAKLSKHKQEVTVLTFKIDEEGNFVEGSISKFPVPLFYAKRN